MRRSKIDEVVPSELKTDLSSSESEGTKETSKKQKTGETKPVKESKYRQPKIDEEAPVDFDSAPSAPKLVEKPPVKEATPPAAAEVPSTPIVRRRGDTFTVVLPSARPPPPPPRPRPPPPPLSPPVPAARIVEMEREEQKVVGRVQPEEEE